MPIHISVKIGEIKDTEETGPLISFRTGGETKGKGNLFLLTSFYLASRLGQLYRTAERDSDNCIDGHVRDVVKVVHGQLTE
jgi:hypothetical protein